MKRDRHYWAGWRDALDEVLDTLHEATIRPLYLKEEIMERCQDLMPEADELRPKSTNYDYAKKYGICLRTVGNWKAEGCPFAEGQWEVLAWAAQRAWLPATMRTRFARQLEKRRRRNSSSADTPSVADMAPLEQLRTVAGQLAISGETSATCHDTLKHS